MFITTRKTVKIHHHLKFRFAVNIPAHNSKHITQYSTESTTMFKSGKIIRKQFIDYFTNNLNHIFIPSSSVIPLCDSSLAFVNSGMNQFKNILLGHHKPPAPRVVNYQKCIRIGGKHNDINVVGLDTYHHTFFEMLGNWFFENYNKEEACKYAWNVLVQLYGIDKNQLYVTYFGGDETLGIKPDLECREIWQKIGVPNDRILAGGMSDNFWEMGMSGPCGLCTEIHIDRPIHSADKLQFKNNPNHLHLTELWNIVFIEFERLVNGDIIPLNKKYVDTGMGFERLVTVIQGKNSNYDTDLFQPLFKAIHKITNAPIYGNKYGSDDEYSIDTGYRIMADHARMITIALADSMIPELNHKLRRVIRKTINTGIDRFQSHNLLYELIYHVAESLGDVYPEIQMNIKQIQTIINYEAELLKSLKASSGKQWQNLLKSKPQLAAISDPYASGLVLSYEIIQSTLKNNRNIKILPGEVAFKIYDTHGLDLEAIEELAQIEGLNVDKLGFEECREKAKIRSRIGIRRIDKNIVSQTTIDYIKSNNIPKTNDSYKYNYSFDGVNYQVDLLESKLLGIIVDDNLIQSKSVRLTREILNGSKIGILLDKTSFYSLEGGQSFDKGSIHINDLIFNINQVYKLHDYVIHYGTFDESSVNNSADIEIHSDDKIVIKIDGKYRTNLMRNHTATHLLNAALRKNFPAIAQLGSIVKNENFSFKFSTFGKEIHPGDLKLIEKQINDCIQSGIPVETKTVNMLELMNEKNLTIIPDEVYPDSNLRIVEIAGPELKSKEACCGTHVHNTGVLQHFSIIDMTSKGLSSKTIIAATGDYALENILKKKENNDNVSKIHIGNTKNIDERKAKLSALIKSELNRIMKSTLDPFIVHCFESSDVEVEGIPLQMAVDCVDVPVFLIAISNRKFKARCLVPDHYLSSTFNAQLWMEAIKKVVPVKIGFFNDENPLVNCHTKVLKLPRDEIALLTENAMTEAENFISTHTKRFISKNN